MSIYGICPLEISRDIQTYPEIFVSGHGLSTAREIGRALSKPVLDDRLPISRKKYPSRSCLRESESCFNSSGLASDRASALATLDTQRHSQLAKLSRRRTSLDTISRISQGCQVSHRASTECVSHVAPLRIVPIAKASPKQVPLQTRWAHLVSTASDAEPPPPSVRLGLGLISRTVT